MLLFVRLIGAIVVLVCVICFILAIKYTYLYAKEEGYEYDFTPFFMWSAYGKYRSKAFKQEEKDSYYKRKCRLTNIYALLSFTAIWIVNCIFQLLGYV